jgi:hypothetical protein
VANENELSRQGLIAGAMGELVSVLAPGQLAAHGLAELSYTVVGGALASTPGQEDKWWAAFVKYSQTLGTWGSEIRIRAVEEEFGSFIDCLRHVRGLVAFVSAGVALYSGRCWGFAAACSPKQVLHRKRHPRPAKKSRTQPRASNFLKRSPAAGGPGPTFSPRRARYARRRA